MLKLRPYQEKIAFWMAARRRCINAMEMRCGKTPTTIFAAKLAKSERILLICPNSLKLNWQMEFDRWYPEMPVTVVQGSKRQREAAIRDYATGVLIVHPEIIRAKRDPNSKRKHLLTDLLKTVLKRQWDTAIVDEAHLFGNRYSLQTAGMKEIAKRVANLWFLTGTPIRNRYTEIWPMLNMIDRQKFSSYWLFAEEGGAKLGFFGWEVPDRHEYPPQIRSQIEPYIKRVLLDDVRKDLPPVTYQKLWLELGDRERKVYSQMEREWLATLANGTQIAAPIVVAQLTRLKQFTVSPDITELPKGGHSYKTAKYEALLEIINGTNEKAIVFSQFEKAITLAAEMLKAAGIPYYRFTGQETPKERDANNKAFKTAKGQAVMLATFQAGGVGQTWPEASIVISLDRMWTPADNEQGYARIRGEGQTKPGLVIELLARNTIDEWIESKLEHKSELIHEIIGLAQKRIEVLEK